jgi:hypothetical protein
VSSKLAKFDPAAHVEKVEIEVTEIVIREVEVIHLAIDRETAETLSRILGFIGGHETKTARGNLGRLQTALCAAGIPNWSALRHKYPLTPGHHGIYFAEVANEVTK